MGIFKLITKKDRNGVEYDMLIETATGLDLIVWSEREFETQEIIPSKLDEVMAKHILGCSSKEIFNVATWVLLALGKHAELISAEQISLETKFPVNGSLRYFKMVITNTDAE